MYIRWTESKYKLDVVVVGSSPAYNKFGKITPWWVSNSVCCPFSFWSGILSTLQFLLHLTFCMHSFKKLLDDLKERRGYSHLKEEALDRTKWRAHFGRGFGPVVRQTNEMSYGSSDTHIGWFHSVTWEHYFSGTMKCSILSASLLAHIMPLLAGTFLYTYQ
jgi:hypothetical protein